MDGYMNNDTVIAEFKSLPLDLQKEVADFIAFLKSKQENSEKKGRREPGLLKGKIIIHPDFDDPLEDFKDYEQ